MKKILLAVLLTLFTNFYTPQIKASYKSYNTKAIEEILINTTEKLKMACIVSKLSNPIMAVSGTLLAIPTLYLLSNYINSKVITKKESDSFFWRFSKASAKFIANLGLTIAGASGIGYQLNKLDIYPNIMQMLGCGTWAEKAVCNKLIWPHFKEEVF